MKLRSGTDSTRIGRDEPKTAKSSNISTKRTKKKPYFTDDQAPVALNGDLAVDRPKQNGDLHENYVQGTEVNGITGTSACSSSKPSMHDKPSLRPHSKWAVILLRMVASYLVFMFFIVPTVLKSCPWILAEITFLNKVRWPPSVDLSIPEDVGLDFTYNFQLVVTQGTRIGAWHVIPQNLQTRSNPPSEKYTQLLKDGSPIVLYLHGNTGTRAGWHRIQLYKVLAAAGFHVIAIDYRGFGDSTGSPTEQGLTDDAFFTYQWILKHRGKSNVYVWGHSLGSGVAVRVTKQICDQGIPISGLILEAPIYNIREAAYHHPFATPFRPMPYYSWVFDEGLKYNNLSFPSNRLLPLITTPTLILHAEDDFIVPFHLGQKLFQEAAAVRKKGVEFMRFEAHHGYGHKHIHKAPELSGIIKKFVK